MTALEAVEDEDLDEWPEAYRRRRRALIETQPRGPSIGHDQLWRRHAACAGGMPLFLLGLVVVVPFDPELFFLDTGQATTARRICGGCPVRIDCLLDVLERREEFGIWGGAGDPVRRQLGTVDRVHVGYDDECRCRFCASVTAHFRRLERTAAGRPPGGEGPGPLQSYGAGARCGTAAKYGRGCRCEPCRTAKREHERAARVRRRGASSVPPDGVADE